MEIELRMLMVVSMVLCLTSAVHATPGKAVFYNSTKIPACSQEQNKGPMVTGVNDALWGNGAACGRRYRVKCTGPANTAPRSCLTDSPIEVTVVDYCRAPCNGDLNLYQDAFAKIADTNAGVVQIDYTQI